MANVSTLTRQHASPLTRPAVSLFDMATMGERCRERRLELGITEVAELARRTAIGGKPALTRSALSQLENGITQELKYENTVRLAAALKVYPDWLAFGTFPKEADPDAKARRGDPKWAAQFSEAQLELLHAVQIYGSILTDDQCRGFAQMLKGSVRVPSGEPPPLKTKPQPSPDWAEIGGFSIEKDNATAQRLRAKRDAAMGPLKHPQRIAK